MASEAFSVMEEWLGGYTYPVSGPQDKITIHGSDEGVLTVCAETVDPYPDNPRYFRISLNVHEISAADVDRPATPRNPSVPVEHIVRVPANRMGELRTWLHQPNGSLCLSRRLALESVEDGGIQVRTDRFDYGAGDR